MEHYEWWQETQIDEIVGGGVAHLDSKIVVSQALTVLRFIEYQDIKISYIWLIKKTASKKSKRRPRIN